MGTVFFIYTTIIICIAVIACSISIMVSLMTNRRDCLCAAAGFVMYAIGTAMIFYDEYLEIKHEYETTFDLPLQHPLVTTLLGIGVLLCVWIWVLSRTHTKVTPKNIVIPCIIFSLGCVVLVPRESAASPAQQWLYWIWRDFGVVACLAFAARQYKRSTSKAQRLDMERSKRFFYIACFLICMVIAEDTFMIMLFRPSGRLAESMFFWYLGERNISENMLMIACGFQLLRRYRDILTIYAKRPRTEEVVDGELAVSASSLNSRLEMFADAHSLSRREAEVLGLLLSGMDTRNIASELVLSPGTVKAHLHRIYVKAGVSTRDDLIAEFWRA